MIESDEQTRATIASLVRLILSAQRVHSLDVLWNGSLTAMMR